MTHAAARLATFREKNVIPRIDKERTNITSSLDVLSLLGLSVKEVEEISEEVSAIPSFHNLKKPQKAVRET